MRAKLGYVILRQWGCERQTSGAQDKLARLFRPGRPSACGHVPVVSLMGALAALPPPWSAIARGRPRRRPRARKVSDNRGGGKAAGLLPGLRCRIAIAPPA